MNSCNILWKSVAFEIEKCIQINLNDCETKQTTMDIVLVICKISDSIDYFNLFMETNALSSIDLITSTHCRHVRHIFNKIKN